MSESKHTPGPWRVFRSTDGRVIIGIGESDGGGITDAGFGTWRDGAEQEANAQLIAAAPELLAALKSLVAERKREWGGFGHHPGDESANAAIAKAEGRAP